MAHSKLINELENGEIVRVRLTDSYPIKPFDCGVLDLNDFLFNDAKTHLKYLSAVTYLFENKDKTIAYYSLQNDLLNIDPHIDKEFDQEISEIIADKDYSFLLEMKDISMYPAAKIGRFAVDTEFQRRGYGTHILHLIIMSFLTNITLSDYYKPSRQMYKNLIALKQLEYL